MAKATTSDHAHRLYHASRQLDKTDLTPHTPVPFSAVQRQSRLSETCRESFKSHHLQRVGGGKQQREEEERRKLKAELASLKQQKAERLVKVEVEVDLRVVKLEGIQPMKIREEDEEIDNSPSVEHTNTIKLEPTDPLVATISMELVKQEEVEPNVQILDVVASTSSQAYDSIPCATKDKAYSPPEAPMRWLRSLDKGKGRMIGQNVHSPRYRPYTPSPLSRPPLTRTRTPSPAIQDLYLPLSPLSLGPTQADKDFISCSTSQGHPSFQNQAAENGTSSSQSKTREETQGTATPSGRRDTAQAGVRRRVTPPKPPKPPPVHGMEEEDQNRNWENPFRLPTSSTSITSHSPLPRFTTTYDWPVYQLPPPAPPIIKPFGSRERKEDFEGRSED